MSRAHNSVSDRPGSEVISVPARLIQPGPRWSLLQVAPANLDILIRLSEAPGRRLLERPPQAALCAVQPTGHEPLHGLEYGPNGP